MENQAEWPLIVRALQMRSLPTGSPAAIEAGLRDPAGQVHTLRLSSVAAASLCAMLTYHIETRLTLPEAIPERAFRVDRFAPALNILIESAPHIERDRIAAALSTLAADHPNFDFAIDELGITLGGIDELQLTQIREAAQRLLGVEIIAGGNVQPAYRERITQRAEIDYTHKKQLAGRGEFARVKLVLEPTPDDYDCTFNAAGVRRKLSDDFISAVERGVRSGFVSGPLTGFSVIGMRVMLVDGAVHESDSTPNAFEMAGSAAIREAVKQAEPQILEPILRVEITAPERYTEAIIADLKARYGGSDGRGRRSRNGITFGALIPASRFIGYADALSSLTETHGVFSAQFERYVPVSLESSDDPSFRPAAAIRA